MTRYYGGVSEYVHVESSECSEDKVLDTTFKHTAGPYQWEYSDREHHDGQITDKQGNLLAIVSGYNYSCYFGGKDQNWNEGYEEQDLAEHIANAKLFAASPCLVEALQEVVSDLFYQIEAKHGPEVASKYPSIVKARIALDKLK